MKRIGIIFGAMLCANIAYAETFTMTWLNEDKTTTYDTTTCESGDDITLPTAPTKRGYTFMGWGPNYTPIEYLEATGTQYIDTGFNFPYLMTRYKIVLDFSVPQQFLGTWDLNGYGGGLKGPYMGVQNQSKFVVGMASNYSSNVSASLNTRYIQEMDMTNGKYKVTRVSDNTTLVDMTFPVYTNTVTRPGFLLFAFAEVNNQVSSKNKNRIYSFKIYDNDTLVRDMIPVKDMNNVPCMFDKVNYQFYYNAGTGTFTAGPAL